MRGMNDLLRQANLMQSKIAKLQKEMGDQSFFATSGGGMVKVEVTGKQELKSITIDPAALEGSDAEMLQDLILTAVNEGIRVSRTTMEREMNALTGGLRLPGGIF